MAQKLKFTAAAIRALPNPPAGSRAVYVDTEISNLQLRVTATGVKTFSLFRRTKGGAPTRMTLGRFPQMTAEGARKQAAIYNLQMEAGDNPAGIRKAERQERTFGQLFDDYIARHAKPRKRTWKEDVAKYERYLKRTLGGKKLSNITGADLAAVHATVTREGHATTANRVLALASSVFGWAVSAQLAATNPALGLKRNPERKRSRFLQPKELPRFFVVLADEPNSTVRDYFLVSLLTGARRSNVLAMKWKELDLDDARWDIPRTKNEEPQTIPLTQETVAILRSREGTTDSAFVFPGHGRTGHLVEPKGGWRRIFDRDELRQLTVAIEAAGGQFARVEGEQLSAALERARKAAQRLKIDTSSIRMDDLRIHDLRRTLGSWQARTGASLSIIGKSLNHKSVQTTAIYARLDTDPVRESVERATSAMLTAAGLKPAADVKAAKRRRR